MKWDCESDFRVGKVLHNLPWGNGDGVLSNEKTGSLKGREYKTWVTGNLESSKLLINDEECNQNNEDLN